MMDPLDHLSRFPLLDAIFGRRARRLGLGVEIPSGRSYRRICHLLKFCDACEPPVG